jgi:outer membrane protein
LSLQRAIELGLANNLDAALQRNNSLIAHAKTESAASDGRAKLSLGGYLTVGDTPMIFSGAPTVDPNFRTRIPQPGALDLNAILSVPVFTGGLFAHRLEAAREAEKAALARQAFSLQETARGVREAYLLVLEDASRLEITEWEIAAESELLRVAQLQLATGKVARFVVLRARAELANALQKHNRGQAALEQAKARLMTVLGVAVDSDFTYPDQLAGAVTTITQPVTEESHVLVPSPPATLQSNIVIALQNRLDLVAARFGVEEGRKKILEAQADFSPQGYLVGMLEDQRVNAINGPIPTPGYGVGLVVSWALLDGGSRSAQLKRTRAEKQSRDLDLQKLEQLVAEQVVTAQSQLVATTANLELAQNELSAAVEDLRVVNLRFAVGRSIYLEVLDGLCLVTRASNNLAEASYDANLAYTELLYATGKLL